MTSRERAAALSPVEYHPQADCWLIRGVIRGDTATTFETETEAEEIRDRLSQPIADAIDAAVREAVVCEVLARVLPDCPGDADIGRLRTLLHHTKDDTVGLLRSACERILAAYDHQTTLLARLMIDREGDVWDAGFEAGQRARVREMQESAA